MVENANIEKYANILGYLTDESWKSTTKILDSYLGYMFLFNNL